MSAAASMSGLNTSMHGDKTIAGALAVAMHVLFVVLLIFGVSWQKKLDAPVQADLWSSLPPLPQPKAALPPAPEPPKHAPPTKVEPKPVPKPDIALKKKEVEKKKPEPKPEPKRDDKAEKARLVKEAEDKRLREERDKRDLDLIRKEREADAAAAAKAQAAAAAKAAGDREAAKFIAGIRTKVHAHVRVPENMQGNPEALVSVSLLPGGELLEARLVRSSGNAEYDQAVINAIRSAQPFNVPGGDLFDQYFRRFNMPFRPVR